MQKFFGDWRATVYNGVMKKLLSLVVLLSGCASLEDFQSMSPDVRADYVCERHRDIIALDAEIDSVDSFITDTEYAIARGYRLHRSCRRVPTVVSTEERCRTETDEAGAATRVCKEESQLSHTEICEDVPISIDGDLERAKLADYESDLRALQRRVDDEFNTCHGAVRAMSPTRAFEYYESVRGGVFL